MAVSKFLRLDNMFNLIRDKLKDGTASNKQCSFTKQELKFSYSHYNVKSKAKTNFILR